MRSPSSGRKLAALGRDDRAKSMLAASVSHGVAKRAAQTGQIAGPSAQDRGINHLAGVGEIRTGPRIRYACSPIHGQAPISEAVRRLWREVENMLTEPITRVARVAPESLPPAFVRDETALRYLALRQIERVRNFRLHLATFVAVTTLTAGVWALTEYQNTGGWPERLNDNGGPGAWNPWILWMVLAWGLIVAVHGLNTYFRRPTTEAEVERELDRLKSRA